MKKLCTTLAAFGLTAAIAAAPTQADTVSFSVFQNTGGVNTSNVDVSLKITTFTPQFGLPTIRYEFQNLANDGSSIIGVYLESELGSLGNNPSIKNNSGTVFSATSSTPPIADWDGNFVAASSSVSQGLNHSNRKLHIEQRNQQSATASKIASETLKVGSRIALLMSISGNDVWLLSAPLGEGQLLPPEGEGDLPGEDDPYGDDPTGGEGDTPVVPVPAALWPGLALIGGLILRRRRL